MFGDFMKRVISLLLCILLIFSVCGCGGSVDGVENKKDTPTVILPDETTKQTLNGYKNEDADNDNKTESNKTDDSNSAVQFYANKSSKKFHKSDCTYATKIKSENLLKSNNKNELLSNGYEACKKCNP